METQATLPKPATPETPSPVPPDLEQIFQRLQANAAKTHATSANARIEKLKRLRAALFDHRQAIKEAVYADFSKAPEEVDLTEILPVSLEINHTVKHLKRWMKPKKVSTPLTLFGTSSEIRYEPKGVGLIISPWNYPINLTLSPLVGAVAAGCPVILKPSEYTVNSSRLMKQILQEVFPEDEVLLLEGDYRLSQALLRLRFAHIYFTGSPEVGKIVMRAAADHLASVTLELGGKSPTIVDETADITDAAKKVVFGKFTNKGQTCIAPDYVLVHETQHDAFVNALRDQIHLFYGTDAEARASTSDYARIINDRHYERLSDLYRQAIHQGAKVATGATGNAKDRYIDPTVLTEVSKEASIMQEEIFGPVLPILTFKTLDEALHMINNKTKPLALYVFSRSEQNIERILAETTAGGTCINDTLLHFMHPELPFGGVGTSGIGKGYGYYGFLAFTNERPVLRQKLKNGPFKYFYPPYTKTTRKLVDLLLKYF